MLHAKSALWALAASARMASCRIAVGRCCQLCNYKCMACDPLESTHWPTACAREQVTVRSGDGKTRRGATCACESGFGCQEPREICRSNCTRRRLRLLLFLLPRRLVRRYVKVEDVLNLHVEFHLLVLNKSGACSAKPGSSWAGKVQKDIRRQL